ncbi:MAG: DUF3341 domain-containing protein [Sporocytophaga sp.]|uniref:DUF3341 domain-containing protein n=1 Tax=Sporocytophaga sp. TaxID=2231183 RepID=UPI001B1D440E|nr:DUF3341 domain-containing protein [Sporocytophaga sp.]MBO9702682.1 DUF3341 domain-containing protein [Sporocytophaga sp.]
MSKSTNYIIGVFNDEDVLMDAVSTLKSSGVKIQEAYTPFPVHGLDDALGYKPSNLPIAAFLFGLTGTICALLLTIGTMGFDWPMDIGGKPFVPLPHFIPVTFELTILLASLGMVATFLIISNLKPWGHDPFMFDGRSTDDKFLIVIDLDKNKMDKVALTNLFKQTGASEVNSKIVENH